jgi:hypothetical protein
MDPKIAVAVVHGVGKQDPAFAKAMIAELAARFARERIAGRSPPADDLVATPVYWAPVLQDREVALWQRLGGGREADFASLRRFLADFAADGIAYQPLPQERNAYDAIHAVFAEALGALARAAGTRAPLVVIAHSLGSVIASNYIYDLQDPGGKGLIAPSVRAKMGNTALERGETLAALYTLGSPIAFWSTRSWSRPGVSSRSARSCLLLIATSCARRSRKASRRKSEASFATAVRRSRMCVGGSTSACAAESDLSKRARRSRRTGPRGHLLRGP